ncbi:D-inositol 3-phosphate glycosyltransferase [Rubripirellula tenax]|uniref:D-inositol 3-phosphate glycosyltransferase n=2 Tax=Rubripirellula tenax TaxID=2528015 RepID=A0A5C6ECQ0_9BACT|nr:D-inositol 3-phosphate glycosyltransferase [Rubripirellula tenax]
MWLPTNRAVSEVTSAQKVIRIISPRGMLSSWAMGHGKLKKRMAWQIYQKRNLATATAFHATGQQEAEDLRSLGFQQPIAVIPNGVVTPVAMPPRTLSPDHKNVLFLSRIHPVKGLLNLVQAWAHVKPSFEWKLVLAGPDESDHRRDVESLAKQLEVFEQIEFLGAVDDCEKWHRLRNADLFVLPSFSENFGIAIAESLLAELPVITTTATPWQALAENDIGWCVDPTADAIAIALREAVSQTEECRMDMGRRGGAWARDRFAWPSIASQMISFYRYLQGKENRPGFVI